MISSNTNWNLYKYFFTVYETKNINRAAELLCVSRPAVSQNIKELNNQLGVTLFKAHPKGVEPTNEADILYRTISKVVGMIIDVESQISGGLDTVSTAAHGWFAQVYIDGYVKEFRAQYPNVKLVLSHEVDFDLLKARKLDFIIDADFLFSDINFSTIDIFGKDVQGYFIASKDYAEKHGLLKPVTIDEIIKHPIIDRKELLQKHWGLSLANAKPFKTTIEVQSEVQIPPMVRNGIGIGMLNELALHDLNDPNIVRLQVQGFILPKTRFVCAFKSTLSRSAQVFVDGLLQYCRNKFNFPERK